MAFSRTVISACLFVVAATYSTAYAAEEAAASPAAGGTAAGGTAAGGAATGADGDVECDSPLCNGIVDYAMISAAMDKAQKAMTKIRQNAVSALVDTTTAPAEEGFGASCLDGLIGMDLSTSFVDLTSPWPLVADAIKDQLLAAACGFVVSEANAKMKEANAEINAFGEVLDDQSYGLLGVESETNNSGDFSYKNTVKTLQDSETLKKANKAYNKAFKEKVLNGKDVKGSELDLTDDKYYNEKSESKVSIKATITKDKINAKVDSAICMLIGGCEEEEDGTKKDDKKGDSNAK